MLCLARSGPVLLYTAWWSGHIQGGANPFTLLYSSFLHLYPNHIIAADEQNSLLCLSENLWKSWRWLSLFLSSLSIVCDFFFPLHYISISAFSTMSLISIPYATCVVLPLAPIPHSSRLISKAKSSTCAVFFVLVCINAISQRTRRSKRARNNAREKTGAWGNRTRRRLLIVRHEMPDWAMFL